MKIRTKSELQAAIENERSWRRKELTNILFLIQGARAKDKSTLLRAGVLLLYSHWEGFIKKSTQYFFMYLNSKGERYSNLKMNFRSLGILNQFQNDFPYKQFNSYLVTTQFLLNKCKDENFYLDVERHIDTRSNLNLEVVKELSMKLGISSEVFENNGVHIDNRLLKYRNAISHGENTELNGEYSMDETWYKDLYTRINELMDHFVSVLLNHVELETYKEMQS